MQSQGLTRSQRSAQKGLFCSFNNPFYQWCNPAQNGDHTTSYKMLISDAWNTALLKPLNVALWLVAEAMAQAVSISDVEK